MKNFQTGNVDSFDKICIGLYQGYVFGTFHLQEQTAFEKGQRDLFNIQIKGPGKFQKSKVNMCKLFRQSLYLLKMWKI